LNSAVPDLATAANETKYVFTHTDFSGEPLTSSTITKTSSSHAEPILLLFAEEEPVVTRFRLAS